MKATKSGYLIEEITTLGLSVRGVAMLGMVYSTKPYRKKKEYILGGEKYN